MAEFYQKQTTLGAVTTPRGEELRLTIAERQSKPYIDIRTWYPDEDGEMKPGKGLGKPADQILPLLSLVETIGVDKLLEEKSTWKFDGTKWSRE